MKNSKASLNDKITKYTIFVIIVTTLLAVCATAMISWNVITKNIESNITNTAKLVAKNNLTIEALLTENPFSHSAKDLQEYINSAVILDENVDNINLIVVCDMQAKRFTHPDMDKIGKRMVGGDEPRVLDGESYVTTAIGTLGQARRAFEPVFDKDGNQIGYVLVGMLTNRITKLKQSLFETMLLIIFTLVGFGTIASIVMSKRVKRDLLNYEPTELTNLYLQKIGILDSINDGIIAIDKDEEVVLINESAAKMLCLNKENYKGKNIKEICPHSTLPNVLKTTTPEYDVELIVNQTLCICNHIPINGEGGFYGAVSVFKDKTVVAQLAEQLTGVNSIVDSLRANNHEFMNKLHIILGMLELGEAEQAKKYIAEINHRQQQMVCGVIKVIEDPKVAGLILGKFSVCAEHNIKLQISTASNLKVCDNRVTSNALTTIIGNLLNNAIDAVRDSDNAFIFFDIRESEFGISIMVSDNGIGISDENIGKVYEKGFSTKQKGFGVGLNMVYNTVKQLDGEITIESEVNQGTTFEVFIPKGEKIDG